MHLWIILLATSIVGATSPCPWASHVAELESSCICDYNLARELSIQCDIVDFNQLESAIKRYATKTIVDLLYINNSTIGVLHNASFATVRINNIQLSGCKITTIENQAFKGQENSLKTLNLKDNQLKNVPSESLKLLRNLTVLDLSVNKISHIDDGAFSMLPLVTLKLADNEAILSPGTFRGLEKTLKNLNLKGTRQKKIPEALRGLKTLAFLDLSQNSIRELPGESGQKAFEGLDSLTGLNLERNLIQNIADDAFYGIKRTLSSLSLLNNLIPDFPTAAINSVHDLRVLDIGFNLITALPINAFSHNPSLTLLAIDGNPLSTVPEEVLTSLNGTLRGLSIGGRFLVCDCKLSWIIDWIRNKDLQVTSRERKPQFCGSPARLQDRNFYNIEPQEMMCERPSEIIGIGTVESVNEPILTTLSTMTTTTTTKRATTRIQQPITSAMTTTAPTTTTTTATTTTTNRPTAARTGNVVIVRTTLPPTSSPAAPSPPPPPPPSLYKPQAVTVRDAVRQDNSVIIYWDTQVANILGFRVVYRLFGDSSFKQAPPLEASEREFKIKNVPSQECIVVCVVSLEEMNITPSNVPYNQCREVRTENSPTSNMDKITIAASAAICATIVVAVIIFVVANRRRARKLHTIHSLDQTTKIDGPIAGLPVNCCANIGATPSPAGPIASSMATLSAYNSQKEWDQVSAYSNRSIPRPRIFPIDRQSQHSFSNNSSRYFANAALANNLVVNSRPELRHSRQSLATAHTSARRQRPRSTSRTIDQNPPPRPGSRYSLADSTHTLNNYDEQNNWTDHDMDIYMARNPTTRSGLVPL